MTTNEATMTRELDAAERSVDFNELLHGITQAALAGFELEIEPCELKAITGMIAGKEPSDESDSGLRWDILQAPHRSQMGKEVSQRDLALNSLFNQFKTVTIKPATSTAEA